MKNRELLPYWPVMFGLLLLLGIVFIFSLGVGAVYIAPREVLQILWAGLRGMDEQIAGTHRVIILDLRLSRALLAIVIGTALAAAGAAFQGLFRNPLADPFIIGASSGAALGATIAIISGFSAALGGFGPIPAAAFVGSVAAVGIVYGISHYGSGSPPAISLLLAGTALSSILSAGVSFLMAVFDQDLHQIFFWLMGGLSARGWTELLAVLPYIGVSLFLLFLAARPLDILAFGESAAGGMGLRVKRARLFIVCAASLATAAAVAVAGIIGFLGLLAPHMARLLFGPAHRKLIPASAIIGALLLLVADDLARTLLAPMEIPVGVLTSLLGGPFFLYLLKSRQHALGGE